jgi:hypothetical protein
MLFPLPLFGLSGTTGIVLCLTVFLGLTWSRCGKGYWVTSGSGGSLSRTKTGRWWIDSWFTSSESYRFHWRWCRIDMYWLRLVVSLEDSHLLQDSRGKSAWNIPEGAPGGVWRDPCDHGLMKPITLIAERMPIIEDLIIFVLLDFKLMS